MTLAGLLDLVSTHPALAEAVATARTGVLRDLDLAAPPGLRPFVIAALAVKADRPVLAVTATDRETEDLAAALRSLLPPEQVAEFPAWETLPHERISPRSDTVGRRLAVLRRLAHPEDDGPLKVVVAPVRSVLQPQVKGLGDLEPVHVESGDEIGLEELVRRLEAAAYTRTDLVEKRGEYAVRGGILDVFPPTEEHPLRLEFWGDTVEEIRYFKVADQRSLEKASALWAPPCRELLLTPEVRERARRLAGEHPGIADILEQLAEGVAVEGMEALAPVLAEEMELLLDVLPGGAHLLVCDPERVRARAADLVRTSQEFLEASWAAAATGEAGEPSAGERGGSGGRAPLDLGAASLRTLAEVRQHARELGLPWWSLTPFTADTELAAFDGQGHDPDRLTIEARAVDTYRGDTARALADVKAWVGDGWRVVLVTEGRGPAERIVEVLRGEGFPARLDPTLDTAPEASVVHVTTGTIRHGFVVQPLRLAVLTETDLAGQKSSTRDMRRMPSKRRQQVDPLQLRPGDYVVHEQHGIGRYVEMTQRTVQGATREYLVIEYAPSKRGQPGDRLYVPTDQLDQVTKYVGGETPTLHRLGGADWQKAKGRARKAIRQIAGELIRLYSARMASPGHAFSPDTPWQRELEDAFPYPETPDQLACIQEVKADMEKAVPMDRLICGDVGYGKTEIAVRAAFKAVQDGKQVAVLVPTTLLVQQHYNTFSERYANFPVTVKALSRFQTDKEAEEVLRGLADGTVDVVIGTHRLLSPETRFKDLGLVIVDEEQRFGVEHKEYLKHMRTAVDVLTMSATPIPRTLEMAISGIREMSTITTPPEERHPVLTFVGPYDEKQIAAAIRRELLREGQVFYIHNRVETIDDAAARVRAMVPEARVAVAHGQMNEHTLERLIVDFWEKRYDVLVCTTIIESGIDIANANTLIVERADSFGLAQLHQLRGRVGRSRERAYAYFTYPADKPLTENAHERLATIAQHSDLGAGMYVAMKDLEIRGAGNLLGGEQSGHIASIGFDLYVRMVGEAVREFREDQPEQVPEVKVELPVNAHIPHDYVPGDRLRLEAYRRIASAATEEEVLAVREELLDRYGRLPEPVENLLEVACFKALCRRAGVTDVTVQGNHVRFAPVELRESQQLRLQRLYPRSIVKGSVRTILVPRPMTARIGGQPLKDLELLRWCRDLVDAVLLERAMERKDA
ncbi:transcription-repair coupling factor [Carbonactinospora thermoautotrophica]|uniref:Transcription-repair-coupling factor n=1 Tax=Carbonactinospora thermoautotrophica TaxID=1469144 RepID=A0A132N6A7_9ACTN|nr:transcription-repair coupling factor [Carbonactinospora thermoautotrophica]KWX05082.1 transcription-repair coupling factor [Carbonactinospora thermoautotrophica]KWX09330.1 transcription-repair coupling factor [Carbonactinospora thermoautotrophica]